MPERHDNFLTAKQHYAFLIGIGGLLLGLVRADSTPPDSAPEQPTRYGYEIVHAWPHDPQAFTQGLVFYEGMLLESTGIKGKSSLRRVDLTTGKVRQRAMVRPMFFAEGLTVIGSRAYQLTWRSRTGFIYDVESFEPLGQFPYPTEGWGLTNDDESLIMSDGSDTIRFLDPNNFAIQRSIQVRFNGQAVNRLNELEYIEGEIYANIWQTQHIVRIDPGDGRITGIIDLSGLEPAETPGHRADVLNGIAFDKQGERLFVTGKYWSQLFEIRLVPQR